MELEKYVSEVLNRGLHTASFPGDLEIPEVLIDFCWELYKKGESLGREHGGKPTGITIVSQPTNDNFGDLHCHPSSSIGHVDGYSAHSAEDILAIRNNAAKPVFIRFVASEFHIYAVVYRSGYSILDEKQIMTIRDSNSIAAKDFFEKHCPVAKSDRDDAMVKCRSSKEQDEYIRQRRRETPGLGKEMERLSFEVCKTISNQLKFGFYAGNARDQTAKTSHEGYLLWGPVHRCLRLDRLAP